MLGFIATLLGASGGVTTLRAAVVQAPTPARLTVRPSMATGTETRAAGIQRLDSLYPGDSLLDRAYVYVPARCVGKTRCPLVVLLQGPMKDWGGLISINGDDGLFKHYADSLGYILLAPTGTRYADAFDFDQANSLDLPTIDAPLRTVLQHYAINPKHIILMGGSSGAAGALVLGYVNGDIFSHVVGFEGWSSFQGKSQFSPLQTHGNSQFFFVMSRNPQHEEMAPAFPAFVEWLRQQGPTVDYVLDDGTHAMTPERGKLGYDWLTKTGAWR